MAEGRSRLSSPPAVRTGVQLRPVHPPPPTRAHMHTWPRHMLAALARSPLHGDVCLFPAVISVSAAPWSPPWGLLPLLPILVSCPISELGPGLCAANSPPWLPDKPGAAARRVQVQTWLLQLRVWGPHPPTPLQSTRAQPGRSLCRGPRGCSSHEDPTRALCQFLSFGVHSDPIVLGLGQCSAERRKDLQGPQLAFPISQAPGTEAWGPPGLSPEPVNFQVMADTDERKGVGTGIGGAGGSFGRESGRWSWQYLVQAQHLCPLTWSALGSHSHVGLWPLSMRP